MKEKDTVILLIFFLFFVIGIPIYCSCITTSKSSEKIKTLDNK